LKDGRYNRSLACHGWNRGIRDVASTVARPHTCSLQTSHYSDWFALNLTAGVPRKFSSTYATVPSRQLQIKTPALYKAGVFIIIQLNNITLLLPG